MPTSEEQYEGQVTVPEACAAGGGSMLAQEILKLEASVVPFCAS